MIRRLRDTRRRSLRFMDDGSFWEGILYTGGVLGVTVLFGW